MRGQGSGAVLGRGLAALAVVLAVLAVAALAVVLAVLAVAASAT